MSEENIPTRKAKKEELEQTVGQETLFQSAISKSMEDAQIKLIPFVERQIELLNNKALFRGVSPTFSELNEKLMRYSETLLGLTSLYEIKKWDCEQAKEEYNEWFAVRFTEIRDALNPRDVAASKFYSAKEIEYVVLTKYKDERAKLLSALTLAERELSTVQRLIESWKSFQFILSNLSANARAETQALGLSPDLDVDESD